ncbi:MAG: pitrilysin family protein [Planctomycetota bacterium]|nr:pitrilysin family protein [Planctomycetota bacterium]
MLFHMHKVTNRRLREQYFFTILDCGLPLFIIPKREINEKVALIAVRYGSIDNEFCSPACVPSAVPPKRDGGKSDFIRVPEGIAHFLEHSQFKKASGDMMGKFAKYGASPNASTGYQTTSYHFSSTEHFYENLGSLIETVFTSYFNDATIEREKLIIEQELRMYDDMPSVRGFQNLMKNLYSLHPVRISIGGTVESVRTITKELLDKCYRTFYQPFNMVAVVCGDFVEVPEIIERVNREMREKQSGVSPIDSRSLSRQSRDSLQASGTGEIIRKIPDEPKDIKEISIREKMPTSTSLLLIGYKETLTGSTGMTFLKQNIITEILLELLFSKSSRAFSKLYEEKLIDDRFGCSYYLTKTFGFTVISAETEYPDILYERIKKELNKTQKVVFSKKDMERQKRKMIGKFTWVFNSPMAIASMFAGYYFNDLLRIPDGEEVFSAPEIIRKITLDDIEKRRCSHLDERYHSLSVIVPTNQGIR